MLETLSSEWTRCQRAFTFAPKSLIRCILYFSGTQQMNGSKQTRRSWWWWRRSMKVIKTNGDKTFTTATPLAQLRTSVSLFLFSDFFQFPSFSCKKGTRASNGPHLLWHFNLWPCWKRCEGVIELKKNHVTSETKGDLNGPAGSDWRHHGTLHWLLHPQWHRDSLLFCKVLSWENSKRSSELKT